MLIKFIKFIWSLIKKLFHKKSSKDNSTRKVEKTFNVQFESKFKSTYILVSIDDFNNCGFEYGDSLRLEFSNGVIREDVPYYSGYFTKTGEELVVAYPGYPYICYAVNYGFSTWTEYNFTEETTVKVSIAEKAKYAVKQNIMCLEYSNDRNAYDSDEIFANFREINCGSLKPKMFYRGASPCDNQKGRAPYVCKFIKDVGIGFDLNLSDSEEELENVLTKPILLSTPLSFKVPLGIDLFTILNSDTYIGYVDDYYKDLYSNKKYVALSMGANYSSDEYKAKVKDCFSAILKNKKNKPFYIHCVEGKDRTGFICILLEALANASYKEIENDYMLSFKNYFKVEEGSAAYTCIIDTWFVGMIECIVGYFNNIKQDDLFNGAKRYLISCGLSEKEVNSIIKVISKK